MNEKTAGKEKLKVSLSRLQAPVTSSQFGDPVTGTTSYMICIYDGANELVGTYAVARGGDLCGSLSCWSTMSDKGFKYLDKSATADGILQITLRGGNLVKGKGKGMVHVLGRNTASTLPMGIAASLQHQTRGTVQLVTSDGSCFGTRLTQVKKADGAMFSAVGP